MHKWYEACVNVSPLEFRLKMNEISFSVKTGFLFHVFLIIVELIRGLNQEYLIKSFKFRLS